MAAMRFRSSDVELEWEVFGDGPQLVWLLAHSVPTRAPGRGRGRLTAAGDAQQASNTAACSAGSQG